MATILRASDAQQQPRAVAFQFDDMSSQAGRLMADARSNAARVLASAKEDADRIRREAAEAGCKAAMQEVETVIAAKTAPAIDALRQAADDLGQMKQEWLSQWESDAVRLAVAIAEKVIRRELRTQPDITLDFIREALELSAGSPGVQLHLHPEDYRTLGTQVRSLMDAMSSFGNSEVTSDPTVRQGGCRVETRFGVIDQQIETQLRRIEEELIG